MIKNFINASLMSKMIRKQLEVSLNKKVGDYVIKIYAELEPVVFDIEGEKYILERPELRKAIEENLIKVGKTDTFVAIFIYAKNNGENDEIKGEVYYKDDKGKSHIKNIIL